MPSSKNKKHSQTIDIVEEILGGDVNRDLIKVALAAQDNDSIDVNIGGQSINLTLDEPLDVSDSEVQVDLNSQSLGEVTTDIREALKSNDNTELVVRTTDTNGDEQDLQQADSAYVVGSIYASDGAVENTLSATGADSLMGQVKADGQYNVTIEWQDPSGTVIRSETVASNVSADTWTDIDKKAKSDYVNVKIEDSESSSGKANGTLHMN